MIIQKSDFSKGPSFTLGNRVRRQIWNIVYCLFFRTSPRPFHAWRAFLLRAFGARLGENCHVYPYAKIWAPWNLEIGSHVGIADGVVLYCMDKIVVEDYVVISQGAHLCGGSHDYNSENFQLFAKKIVVGKHAWICAEAFVSLGVVIPEGAVIGARSVVTKSFSDPWHVYAGNPCKKIKKRGRTV